MATVNPGTADRRRLLMWVCLGLALVAALGYILTGLGVLGVGDLESEDAPPGITYIAAGCYLLGGGLILLRRRWLWVVGVVMNTLVILTFVSFYVNRPTVLWSPAGIVTKIPQILLEVGLLWLIVTWGRGT
jgi:hypothetical protein